VILGSAPCNTKTNLPWVPRPGVGYVLGSDSTESGPTTSPSSDARPAPKPLRYPGSLPSSSRDEDARPPGGPRPVSRPLRQEGAPGPRGRRPRGPSTVPAPGYRPKSPSGCRPPPQDWRAFSRVTLFPNLLIASPSEESNKPKIQLLTVDHSARGSMKTAANCVS